MEVFLRFSHRYWFHELSAQDLAQRVFHRLRKHLDCESLYEEVRSEVIDMNDYLDSDSFRRQANTVVRLTVVTILGLIGTVTTGFLGMNLIDETDEPLWWRFVLFAVILVATVALTTLTVARSKRLADFLDVLSDERIGWVSKLRALRRIV
jgi:Mg2+ and Co2+ transporter CorA